MDEMDFTRKFRLGDQRDLEIKAILASVYQALQEKGYNPVNQIVGYIPVSYTHLVRLEVLPQVFFRLLGHAAHPAADPLGDVSAAHQQVKDAAEHREGEDEQQPGDLIGGLDRCV